MKILSLIVTINSPTFHSMNRLYLLCNAYHSKQQKYTLIECNLFAISIHDLLYLQLMTLWHSLLGLQLLSKSHVSVEVEVFIISWECALLDETRIVDRPQ